MSYKFYLRALCVAAKIFRAIICANGKMEGRCKGALLKKNEIKANGIFGTA
jgi:hypothetical protein